MAWTAQGTGLLIHSRLSTANFPIVLTPSKQYLLLFWCEKKSKQDAPTSWNKKKRKREKKKKGMVFLPYFRLFADYVSVGPLIPK